MNSGNHPFPRHSAPATPGFSLLELLVVVALLAVLAGLLLPAVGAARDRTRQLAVGHDLRQLGLALIAARSHGPAAIDHAHTVHQWILAFCRETGWQEPRPWLLPDDPLQPPAADWPTRVARRTAGGVWELEPRFARLPLSLEIAGGLPTLSLGSATPMVWTRGLDIDSDYPPHLPGVYPPGQGWVVFLDGSTRFIRDPYEAGGAFVNHTSGERTARLREALPPNARILRSAQVPAGH
jgi:prepilin-type N-terminal cleavage/methylation domain-containing protein